MPPANGTVIVNSSAYVYRIGGAAGASCSITSGTVIDVAFQQTARMPDFLQATAVLAGTRGYRVNRGVPLTVNGKLFENPPPGEGVMT